MRFAVFPDYTAKVARARAAFNEARKLLQDVEGVRYSLLFPAQLRITYNGTQHLFTSPVESKGFISSLAKHFLFKTSSGTTPLFSSSSPGYPLTSGTVYSPPPRLLPRNTFSRSAFKLKKPSKYCSWKCAAVTAIAAAALLAILLSYFIVDGYKVMKKRSLASYIPCCISLCNDTMEE
ncbi:hypothetical protein MHYP_G00113410 [Metynnis hypsauchen]